MAWVLLVIGGLFEIGFGMHTEVDDFLFRDFVCPAQRTAEEPGPVADSLFHTERGPPFSHGSFIKDTAVILEKRAALGKHFVFDHLIFG